MEKRVWNLKKSLTLFPSQGRGKGRNALTKVTDSPLPIYVFLALSPFSKEERQKRFDKGRLSPYIL